jgi:hypothetical protein
MMLKNGAIYKIKGELARVRYQFKDGRFIYSTKDKGKSERHIGGLSQVEKIGKNEVFQYLAASK